MAVNVPQEAIKTVPELDLNPRGDANLMGVIVASGWKSGRADV